VRDRQVGLDEANGNGLLVTVEPSANVPAGAAYLAENQAFLLKQKARILRVDPPRSLSPEIEHLGLDVEMSGRRERMDYFVVRQRAGGAVLAARLLPTDLATLQRDVERIARSVRVAAPAGK